MKKDFVSNLAKNIENLAYCAEPPDYVEGGFNLYFFGGHIKCIITNHPEYQDFRIDCTITANNDSSKEYASETRAERPGCAFSPQIPSYREISRDYTFFFCCDTTPEYVGRFIMNFYEKLNNLTT